MSPLGPLTLNTSELLDAYRRWTNAEPLPATTTTSAASWEYPRFAPVDVDVGTPLGLIAMGDWDPDHEYWGEPDDPLPPLWKAVIAGGVRPCFKMEQVIPGVAADDWDSDPIVDAAELHRAGYHREAIRLLDRLLAEDRRCVDAWGHRGLVAFDTRGPGPALAFYETGVAIAERALPVDGLHERDDLEPVEQLSRVIGGLRDAEAWSSTTAATASGSISISPSRVLLGKNARMAGGAASNAV